MQVLRLVIDAQGVFFPRRTIMKWKVITPIEVSKLIDEQVFTFLVLLES